MSRANREIMGHHQDVDVLLQLLNVTPISQLPGAVDVITQSMLQEYERQKGIYEHKNLAGLKAEGERRRAEFLKEARLQSPQQLRLIDCNSTCLENQVVLVDWADQQQVDYTAISHTYGMEVYDVFNCICTAKCLAKVPRCSDKPCTKHLDPSDPRNRVVQDILGMCVLLRAAGVQYAWHDGVCIAQHNVAEVEETIKHVGWIYASAKETIIFLHYVGSPMALIRHDGDLESRWQTRVWTFQEAAVSKCRRYCVRVGMGGEFGDCQSLQEFEEKVSLWYKEDCSQVAVIDEEGLWKVLMEVYSVLVRLLPAVSASEHGPILFWKAIKWIVCISGWVRTLFYTCFQFPTVATALEFCSLRDSKHVGDRINSILAVAGVKDFVAPKDINMEASTIEFFKRQGQQGLARAVFTTNVVLRSNSSDGGRQPWRHTWVPSLSNPLKSIYEQIKETVVGDERQVTSSSVESLIGFRVLQDGKLELTGELACVAVKFTARSRNPIQDPTDAEGVEGSIMVVQVGPNYYPVYLAMYVTPDTVGFTASLAQASTLELGTAVVPIAGREPESSITEIHGYQSRTAWCRACESLRKAIRAFLHRHGLVAAPPAPASAVDMVDAVETQLLNNGALAKACSAMEPGWMALVPNVSPAGMLARLTRAPALILGKVFLPMLATPTGKAVVQGRQIEEGESFWAYMVLPLQALLRHREYTVGHHLSERPSWDWRVPALLVRGDLRTGQVAKIGCFQPRENLKDVLLVLRPNLTILPQLVIV